VLPELAECAGDLDRLRLTSGTLCTGAHALHPLCCQRLMFDRKGPAIATTCHKVQCWALQTAVNVSSQLGYWPLRALLVSTAAGSLPCIAVATLLGSMQEASDSVDTKTRLSVELSASSDAWTSIKTSAPDTVAQRNAGCQHTCHWHCICQIPWQGCRECHGH